MSDIKTDWNAVKSEINNVTNEIKNLNVNVEICGNWVWISGNNTKFHTKLLRSLGCEFSKAKEMWYFVPPSLPAPEKKSDRTLTIEEIRTHHGSESVKQASAKSSYTSKKRYQSKVQPRPANMSFFARLFFVLAAIYR